MNTLIPHQRLSCRPIDFLLAQLKPYHENALRKFIPKKYLQWTGSARAGISQLLSQGERVGIPAFTCSVVAAAILHAKAVPVYIDAGVILKAEDIEPYVKKIDTLLLPYNFGFMPQMDKMMALCKKNNIRLIEDCAQALGAKSNGKLAGSFGDAAVYSFGISKNIGVLGGMVATDDAFLYRGKFYPFVPRYKIYAEALLNKIFFNQRIYPRTSFLLKHHHITEHVIPHLMPDFAKYLVLVQAKRYEKMLELRRSNAEYMLKELKGHIEFIEPEAGTEPAWLYFVLLHKNRDALRARLLKEGIDVQPMHTFVDISKTSAKATAIEKTHLAFALLRPRSEIEQIVKAIKRIV